METDKKTVYLVEDDEGIREMLEFVLSALKLKVVPCATVKVFKEKMNIALPDLIILDIMLPDGNGEVVGKELSMQETTSAIPILFMSANVKFNLPEQLASYDFIPKPFDISNFQLKINKLLA